MSHDSAVYLLDRDAEGAAAASDIVGQRRLGELFGLFDIAILPENSSTISEDTATVLSDASGHIRFLNFVSEVCDGYFTQEELGRAVNQNSRKEQVTMCNCSAHQLLTEGLSRQRKDDIRTLIRSLSPLTDNGGKQFATSMIRLILDYAQAQGTLQDVSSGSEWSVSYMLRQGGHITQYRGYPDFIVREDGIGATVIVTGVGEMQSDRRDAILQCGIYTVGQFQHPEATRSSMACIALHKNKNVNVFMCRLSSGTNTLGTVSYRYVGDTSPLSLYQQDVLEFASRLIFVLQVH